MKLSEIKYLPLRGLLAAAASMPWWMAYGVADFICFIMCHVWGYRRRIIKRNLRVSFPDMTDHELRRTLRRFYRNFADQIIETLKASRMSASTMRRRMTFNPADIERLDSIAATGRPTVAYFSHCFNWEWAASMPLWSRRNTGADTVFCQIYRPLRNKVIDRMMLRQRGRFSAVSLPKKTAFLDLLRFRRDGKVWVTGFMSDQHPSAGDPGHLMTFLNHPTAMISGTETVARRTGAYVVYWDITKSSRGHYHIDMIELADDPAALPEGELTRRYARALENTIRRDPAIWLWSHNRWKRPVTLLADTPEGADSDTTEDKR